MLLLAVFGCTGDLEPIEGKVVWPSDCEQTGPSCQDLGVDVSICPGLPDRIGACDGCDDGRLTLRYDCVNGPHRFNFGDGRGVRNACALKFVPDDPAVILDVDVETHGMAGGFAWVRQGAGAYDIVLNTRAALGTTTIRAFEVDPTFTILTPIPDKDITVLVTDTQGCVP